MKCEKIRHRLLAFLLGELSARESNRMASHVRGCVACLEELDSLSLTVRLLQQMPEGTLSPGFDAGPVHLLSGIRGSRRQGTRTMVERPRMHSRPAGVGAVAAAGVALLIGLFLLPWFRTYRTGRPTGSLEVRIGKVVRITGQPRLGWFEGKEWQRCRKDSVVVAGAELRTGETDRIEVEFADGSRMGLDFGTSVKIGEAGGRRAIARPSDLYVRDGRVWLLLTRSRARMVVHTPTASAEAMGTLFSVSVEGSRPDLRTPGMRRPPQPSTRTGITVLRGKVRLANRHGAVIAAQGTFTEATIAQPPRPPQQLAHLDSVRLQAPWGQTFFEVWVPERLEMREALERIAGRRSWLGAEITPRPMTLAGQPLAGPGCSVISVKPGSPAENGGIGRGDRLMQVGGIVIRNRAELARSEVLLAPGEDVNLLIRRDGHTRTISVRVARRGPLYAEESGRNVEAANRLFALGRTTEAAERYRRIVDTEPTNGAALNNLGVIYELNGQIEDAVALYRRAALAAAGMPLCRFNLAVGLYKIGNLPLAAEQFEAVLRMDSEFPRARFLLARTRAFLGDYEGAVQEAQTLWSSADTRSSGYCLMGEILRLQGKWDEAEDWYLKASKADPFYIDPSIYLAAVYIIEGSLDTARSWAQRALQLDPSSLRALNRLGLILMRQGQMDKAETVLLRAAALHPESGEVRNNLGLLYLKKQDLRASQAAYRRAVRLSPDALYCHLGLAVALERGQQFAQAKREYAAALALDPTYSEAYERLAALHRRLGETRLAARVLRRAEAYGI